ncbi:MAG: carbon-nitrogen hydrolase [Chloroflexi bacterium]|nr:carbon-nitrogen hydrolase [Chloroflexota bacterium]
MKFKLALAQFAPRLGDVDANLQTMLDYSARAKDERADLIVFPELALTGYYLKDLAPTVAARPSPDDPRFAPLIAASRDLDLIVSFVEADARYRYYIAAAYLSAGRVVHIHRKVYLPTYRLFDDARFFAPGNTFRAFDTRFGRMGILICEDAWHLSSPYVLWQDGADFLIDVSANPGYGISARAELANAETVKDFLRTYASLLTTFVIFSNRVGMEDGIAFWGGSHVLAPDGATLAAAPQFDDALVCAEIDPDALRRARISFPALRDEQRELVRHELGRVAKFELDRHADKETR